MPTYPTPPHTYDDLRVTYDDLCVLYDGGGSPDCTETPSVEEPSPRRLGRGGGQYYRRPYTPPPAPNPLFEITFKVCLKSVNDESKNECRKTTWKREVEPKKVKASLKQLAKKAAPEVAVESVSINVHEQHIELVAPIQKQQRSSRGIVVTTKMVTNQRNKIYLKESIVLKK